MFELKIMGEKRRGGGGGGRTKPSQDIFTMRNAKPAVRCAGSKRGKVVVMIIKFKNS
jgi:hypothetical protein